MQHDNTDQLSPAEKGSDSVISGSSLLDVPSVDTAPTRPPNVSHMSVEGEFDTCYNTNLLRVPFLPMRVPLGITGANLPHLAK